MFLTKAFTTVFLKSEVQVTLEISQPNPMICVTQIALYICFYFIVFKNSSEFSSV